MLTCSSVVTFTADQLFHALMLHSLQFSVLAEMAPTCIQYTCLLFVNITHSSSKSTCHLLPCFIAKIQNMIHVNIKYCIYGVNYMDACSGWTVTKPCINVIGVTCCSPWVICLLTLLGLFVFILFFEYVHVCTFAESMNQMCAVNHELPLKCWIEDTSMLHTRSKTFRTHLAMVHS